MKYLRGQISPKNGTTSKLFNKDNVLLINKQNLTDGFNDSNLNTLYAFFISNTFISNARLKLEKNQSNAKQQVVIHAATWTTFKPKREKIKKNPPT